MDTPRLSRRPGGLGLRYGYLRAPWSAADAVGAAWWLWRGRERRYSRRKWREWYRVGWVGFYLGDTEGDDDVVYTVR